MQPSRATWLFLPALALGGCPMYPDGCSSDDDCGPSYVCDFPSGQCVNAYPSTLERCNTTSDCDPGLVCDEYARCVAPNGTGGSIAVGSGGASGGEHAGGAGHAPGGGAGESGAAGESGSGAAGR
ncbi:MAG TPA: hypothetical protein VMI54_11865 [Polyangiaceae bacterium]|nr:hypothetical protein [Polyangiaceae bacterium]